MDLRGWASIGTSAGLSAAVLGVLMAILHGHRQELRDQVATQTSAMESLRRETREGLAAQAAATEALRREMHEGLAVQAAATLRQEMREGFQQTHERLNVIEQRTFQLARYLWPPYAADG